MKKVITNSVYCTLALVAVFFALDALKITSALLGFLLYTVVFIGFMFVAWKSEGKSKDALLTGVYASLGFLVFHYLFVYVIDPNFVQNQMDTSLKTLTEKGYSQEQIDQSMNFAGKLFNNLTIPLWGLLGSILQMFSAYLIVLFINKARAKN